MGAACEMSAGDWVTKVWVAKGRGIASKCQAPQLSLRRPGSSKDPAPNPARDDNVLIVEGRLVIRLQREGASAVTVARATGAKLRGTVRNWRRTVCGGDDLACHAG